VPRRSPAADRSPDPAGPARAADPPPANDRVPAACGSPIPP